MKFTVDRTSTKALDKLGDVEADELALHGTDDGTVPKKLSEPMR